MNFLLVQKFNNIFKSESIIFTINFQINLILLINFVYYFHGVNFTFFTEQKNPLKFRKYLYFNSVTLVKNPE